MESCVCARLETDVSPSMPLSVVSIVVALDNKENAEDIDMLLAAI